MHLASFLRSQLQALHEDSFGWAMCCCQYRQGDAEEVLQTVYLKILEQKAKYKGKATFRTWLFAVIRNTAKDFYRKEYRRNRYLSPLSQQTDTQAKSFSFSELDMQVQEELILRKLQQLPERQKEVLHLVFYQGLTIGAAAEIMQVGLGTARTHYERGKKRLRQLLQSCKEELI